MIYPEIITEVIAHIKLYNLSTSFSNPYYLCNHELPGSGISPPRPLVSLIAQ